MELSAWPIAIVVWYVMHGSYRPSVLNYNCARALTFECQGHILFPMIDYVIVLIFATLPMSFKIFSHVVSMFFLFLYLTLMDQKKTENEEHTLNLL